MRKALLTISIYLSVQICFGQDLISNRGQIDQAKKDLESELANFSVSLVNMNVDTCIRNLVKNTDNEYKKYLIGGALFDIDPKTSFRLHEEAYLTNKQEQNFIIEYAIELHRAGQFKEASNLYELYSIKNPTDFRIFVWLADCYINLGDIKKSIENWNKSNHAKNHTSIDFAIYTIYGNTTQMRKRSDYKMAIEKGDYSKFYPLILLDQNWETDWWNANSQDIFLTKDLELAKKKLGETNSDYIIFQTYVKIKKLDKEYGKTDSIKKILDENKLIIDNYSLPAFGAITSDLIRICFSKYILFETDFYSKRGLELLELATLKKDKDILNIYAYLQTILENKVNPKIDKLGWKEFKDEKFAISYFIGKADKNRYDDPELKEALADFPNSSKLYWVKTNCAKIENRELKPDLIELIKKEFKTLGSSTSKYSYGLKSYFAILETL